MKSRSRNLFVVSVLLIFSTTSLAAIVEGLEIGVVKADSVNFIEQRDGSLSAISVQNNANGYIPNLHDNTISIISGQTKTVIGSHTIVGKYPDVFTFGSPSNRNTYIVNLHDNTISIISGQTKTVIGNPTFVSNAAGQTTFGHPNAKSYNTTISHKVLSTGAASIKAPSNLTVKTASSVSSIPTIANHGSKVITGPSRPPLIP